MSVSILQSTKWTLDLAARLRKKKLSLTPIPRRQPCKSLPYPVRRRVPYSQPEFENTEPDNTASLLMRPQQEIAARGAHDCIDEMSGLERQLFEDPRFVSVRDSGEPLLFVQRSEENPPEYGGLDSDAEEYLGRSTELAKVTTEDSQLPSNLSWGQMRSLQRRIENIQHVQSMTTSALTRYISDTFPDHPMEKVFPILLEASNHSDTEISIPDYEARAIILLSGTVIATIGDKTISLEKNLEVFELDGPCSIKFHHPETLEEDVLLAIGVPSIEDGRLQTSMDCLCRSLQTLGSINVEAVTDEESLPGRGLSFYSQINPSLKGLLPDIRQLSRDIPDNVDDQKKLWSRETNEKIPFLSWRIKRKLRTLDEVLTLDIDSAYHGSGYVPPSPRWDMIIEDQQSSSIEAADERKMRFEALHKVAKRIETQTSAKHFRNRIRPLNQADRDIARKFSMTGSPSPLQICKQKFEKLLRNRKYAVARCPLCGLEFITAPVYQDYRDAYLHATGQIEHPPSHSSAKVRCPRHHPKSYWEAVGGERYEILEQYPITAVPKALSSFSAKGETVDVLAVRTWLAFDRDRQVTPAEYEYELTCKACGHSFHRICSKEDKKNTVCPNCKATPKHGNKRILWSAIFTMSDFREVSKQKFQRESWWKRDRSKAFEDINLKKSQWNTIYDQLRVQQERIRGHYLRTIDKRSSSQRKGAWSKSRRQAMQILRDLFHDCETYIELREFLSMATQQKINPKTGDIIERSLMDRVTPGDELRIRIAIEKQKKKLASNMI